MIVFLHNDLDAIGCEMCIEEMPFKVSKIFYTNYSDFVEKCNQILEYTKANNEKELLIADLSFAEHLEELKMLVNTFDSVLHIDHHSYPANFFQKVIGKGRYKCKIDSTKCASKICYELFNIENKQLKILIDVIDVYDCWRTESKMFDKSQNLNKYFWERGWDNFKQFKNKIPDDYNTTITKILNREQEGIKKLKESNLIVRSKDNSQKITFVFNHEFFNPVMIEEMNQGQNFVVGIENGIVKFRIRKGVFDSCTLDDLRLLITGKVTGHLLAFTYVIGRDKMDVVHEIQRISKIIENHDVLPF